MVSKNLLIVHQQSGFSTYDRSIKALKYIASKIDYVSKISIVVADNRIQSAKKLDDVYIIPSENRYREFSGWSAAMLFGKGLMCGEPYNLILSNETMLNHRPFDQALLTAFILVFNKCFQERGACYAGDVDRITASPPFYYSDVDRYISTYLCGMNWSAIQLSDSIIPREDYEENFIISFNESSVLADNSTIKNTNYGLMLECYLYKKIPGIKMKKWWDHSKLTPNNYEKFRLKLLSILIEMGISQNLFEKGCRLLDVKAYIKRDYLQSANFFVKRVIFSLRWKINRYKKILSGSL